MRTLRILVVDDQEHMRELLVEALSADGHTVDPAENGTAAIQLFEAQAYDLVVSDLQMPQGLQAAGGRQAVQAQGIPPDAGDALPARVGGLHRASSRSAVVQ